MCTLQCDTHADRRRHTIVSIRTEYQLIYILYSITQSTCQPVKWRLKMLVARMNSHYLIHFSTYWSSTSGRYSRIHSPSQTFEGEILPANLCKWLYHILYCTLVRGWCWTIQWCSFVEYHILSSVNRYATRDLDFNKTQLFPTYSNAFSFLLWDFLHSQRYIR